MKIEKFDTGTLGNIAKIIGDMFTGSELSKMLAETNIKNISQHSTKWRILEECFIAKQNQDNCANNVLNFVKEAFRPARNINNTNYENNRNSINQILSFVGFEIRQSGEISEVKKSVTIDDAKKEPKISKIN